MLTKAHSDEIIHQYGRLRAWAPRLLRRPLGVFFYITGACNLSCTYCWQRDQDANIHGLMDSTRDPMTPEEWVKVVQQLPRPSFLGISGGESTISPSLGPIIRAAADRRIPVTVNTNALTIRDEHLEILTAPNVRNISISIDGFAAIHDVSRNRKGLFDKVVVNIGRLNTARGNRRYPRISIKTVLLNETIGQLAEFRRFCAEILGASTLNISFQKLDEHYQFSLLYQHDLDAVFGTSHSRLYPYRDRDEVIQVLGDLIDGNERSHCEVVLYPRMKTRAQIRRFLEGDGVGVYEPCYLPLSMVVVLPDGEVIPCQSFGLGNLRDSGYSLRKVLKAEPYTAFLKRLESYGKALPSGCSVCCFSKIEG
ncbi:MAG: radical SAM protein [Phaeospirillum sp.]|nr:radical SAM protein [Phaeospirillum sp.]